jgi:hypothetical protein
MVPWTASVDELRKEIDELDNSVSDASEVDLIIHAPVNGVLNIPDHGLEPAELAALGFRRVFAGHYHDHKVFEGGKIISIGATTQQTFSDIGTKAGFLMVYEDRVEWRASHAPSFVEITHEADPDEWPLIAAGNYVRLRGFELTEKDINQLRDHITKDCGAKGVIYEGKRAVASERSTTPPKTATLDAAVMEHVDTLELATPEEATAVKELCGDILSQVRSLSE